MQARLRVIVTLACFMAVLPLLGQQTCPHPVVILLIWLIWEWILWLLGRVEFFFSSHVLSLVLLIMKSVSVAASQPLRKQKTWTAGFITSSIHFI